MFLSKLIVSLLFLFRSSVLLTVAHASRTSRREEERWKGTGGMEGIPKQAPRDSFGGGDANVSSETPLGDNSVRVQSPKRVSPI